VRIELLFCFVFVNKHIDSLNRRSGSNALGSETRFSSLLSSGFQAILAA